MIGAVVEHLPCFRDLIAVLFECFLIISLGYLSCRFKLISTQAKDLNSYLTTFALPMIIFLNIAQMEFQTINLSFLICMLTSKLLVFILVTTITLLISYPTNFGYAGALSILATQSNDFALGYPLIKSLYGESRQEMLNYLSLMAPIQLLILNPLGIVMLEYEKSRKSTNKLKRDSSAFMLANDGQQQQQQRRCSCQHQSIKKRARCQSFAASTSNSDSSMPAHKLGQHLRPRRTSLSCHNNDALDSSNVLADQQDRHQDRNLFRKSLIQNRNVNSLKLVIPAAEITSNESGNSDVSYEQQVNVKPDAFASRQQGKSSVQELKPPTKFQSALDNPLIIEQPTISTCCFCLKTRTSQPVPAGGNSNALRAVSTARTSMVNLNFLRALATNPLIIASVVALAVNLIHGPELPKLVTRVSNTIAASFAAPALFVVGLSMFGKFELLLKNPNDLLLSSVLVLTKVVVLPNVMRTLALIILPAHTPADEIPYLIDFSFLYGLLPTAPTACIIAKQYNVLTNVVSISMLLSIFMSAPLMLAASVIINPASIIKLSDIEALISQTLKLTSLMTFLLATMALYSFWRSKKRIQYKKFIDSMPEIACIQNLAKIKTNPTHIFLFLLAVTQIMIGIGGLSWFFIDSSQTDSSSLQFFFHSKLNSQQQNSVGPIPSSRPNQTATLAGRLNDYPAETPMPLPAPIPEQDLDREEAQELVEEGEFRSTDSVHFNLLTSLQYVLASSGILLARFVILCILITTATIRFRGYTMATRISALMAKSFLVMAAIMIVWLVYDSHQMLKHFPAESTLPDRKSSLYIRLLYDSVFVLVSIPLFAFIIRSDNKSKRLIIKSLSQTADEDDDSKLLGCADSFSHNNDEDQEEEDEEGLVIDHHNHRRLANKNKRHFVRQSNTSLSSDTSSAVTTNTNLDTSNSSQTIVEINNNAIADSPQTTIKSISSKVFLNNSDLIGGQPNTNKKAQQPIPATPKSTVIDCDGQQAVFEQSVPNRQDIGTSEPGRQFGLYGTVGFGSVQEDSSIEARRRHRATIVASNATSPSFGAKKSQQNYMRLLQLTEFNKYSILILFMLIATILNLTSIIQKLIQDKPFGTFRQIEIMGVALEFGQGLLTFMIYGVKGLFN